MKSRQKLNHVLVSGGTHGNEYTGVFLIRHWLQNAKTLQRNSFTTIPLFANPKAFEICRRYVERDLNRSFHPTGLLSNPDALELKRAAEIESELRRACNGQLPEVIFDLHSTTARMGLSLVLTDKNPFNLLLYAYLRTRLPDVRAYLWHEPNSNPGFLNSLSERGFAIEIGAVANGVLDAEWVLRTQSLVSACLDFVELWNLGKTFSLADTIPLFVFRNHVDYPRDADGLPAAMIHPTLQDKNFRLLTDGDPVFIDFDGRETLWRGGNTFPVFINEAAYYEKGIAFTLTDRIEIRTEELKRL